MTAELRELAEAATPGPWTVAGWHRGTVITERWADESAEPDERGPFVSIGASNHHDAAFIAAANPTAVLGLLNRLETQRRTIRRLYAMTHPDSVPSRALDDQ